MCAQFDDASFNCSAKIDNFSFSHSRDMIDAHQNLNGSRDLTTPLTYKILTIIQPPYLHNIISVQRPHSTGSSSVVALAGPPTSSCLKIYDRFTLSRESTPFISSSTSFRYQFLHFRLTHSFIHHYFLF